MASKKAAKKSDPAPKPNELQVKATPGKTDAERFAELAIAGVAGNAATSRLFTQSWMGELGITESFKALKAEIAEAQSGDLRNAEAMLFGQARALEAVFHSCMNRSAANMGKHPEAVERYMRLGLKAQSQCRTTLQALVETKFPKSVAFVRQANIAGGHQQVNNEVRAEERENPPNELQEVIDGRSVAYGAQAARIGADKGTATVVEIDRPAYAGRKG